jgi:hypothetical protein
VAVFVVFLGGLVGGCGVPGAREGVKAGPPCFSRVVDSRFSTVCTDGGATVDSDVARVVAPLGCSSGGWDSSRGVVDELRGETRSGGAVRCSGVVEVGRVVVVVVVDGCDVAVDACDVGCDEGTGGEVSVGRGRTQMGGSWSRSDPILRPLPLERVAEVFPGILLCCR